MTNTIVIKLGGSTLGSAGAPDTTLEDLLRLVSEGNRVVLVHGGGNAISELLKKLGYEPRFYNGLRVTDQPALEAALMVMRGQINAELVSAINRSGYSALGLSGLDGRLLEARRDTEHGEVGMVGEVVRVNPTVLDMAFAAGFIPVVSPFGVGLDDPETAIFNINADNAAAWIAAALSAQVCIFLTDVPGVLDKDKQTIAQLTPGRVQELMEDGTIYGGMIPKMRSALKALEGAEKVMIIDGRQPHALYNAISNPAALLNGTTFSR